MCALTAAGLGVEASDILICQTGLIGIPLPMAPIESGIPALLAARAPGEEPGRQAATAIMTTDVVRKEVVVEGPGFRVGAMAKGAAMLAPHMATMLAVLTTDAACAPTTLQSALRRAVAGSFNRLTIDGCTSTNDTVLVLASGRAGDADTQALTAALTETCDRLAGLMAADAEGGSRVVHVVVTGALSDDEAHRAARKVADSNLVKCSVNGEDPYWGRVVSELGSAGVAFDIDRVEVGLRRHGGLPGRGGRRSRRQGRPGPHGAGPRRDQLPARSGHGHGRRAGGRPRPRLHRREPDDLVTATVPGETVTGDTAGTR